VAYHDACHLAHAQGVTTAPRQLLRAIPGLTLLEASEAGMCCGSAGVYNLEQPELAERLGQRRAEDLMANGTEAIATSNIGCIIQLRSHLQKLEHKIPVVHFIELLAESYASEAGD
jgi:glycolate oxidase iron-sulfur subunit